MVFVQVVLGQSSNRFSRKLLIVLGPLLLVAVSAARSCLEILGFPAGKYRHRDWSGLASQFMQLLPLRQ